MFFFKKKKVNIVFFKLGDLLHNQRLSVLTTNNTHVIKSYTISNVVVSCRHGFLIMPDHLDSLLRQSV